MVTGPAHCSKRMSRSSRYVKWLTLSRPPLPPGRGQASCGIRLRMRKNICFRHLGFPTIQREICHRESTSEGVSTSCVYTSWELRIHKTEVYTHVWTPCVYTSWELHICRTVARLRGPFLPTTSPPRKTFCRMPKTSARTFRYLNHGLNSSPCLPLLA